VGDLQHVQSVHVPRALIDRAAGVDTCSASALLERPDFSSAWSSANCAHTVRLDHQMAHLLPMT